LRAKLNEEKLSRWTIKGYLGNARNFLVYLDEHNIPIRSAQPSDVARFLSKQRQRYRRQNGKFPQDEIQWRCERTPAVHRLLGLAQGCWPPATDVDRRVTRFRRKLLKDEIDAEALRKYESAARHFLGFLDRLGVQPEHATRDHEAAFLQDRLKAYRRSHQHSPGDLRSWQRGYLTGIHRLLRGIQGQWPPTPRQDPELHEYKQHLVDQGIHYKTILDYCLHARLFLDYLRAHDTRVDDLQPKDVEAFYRVALRLYRKRKPHRANSLVYWRAISRRSVNSFLRFRRGEWPPDKTPSVVVRFKHHLEGLRYSARVIVHQVWAVRRFVTYLEQLGLTVEVVRPTDVETFLDVQSEQFRKRHRRAPGFETKWRSQFMAPICSLLRMVDPQWPPATPPSSAHEQLQRKICDGYGRWLTDVQGLSAATLCKNGDAARVFLRWLHEHADVTSLRRLSVNNLDAYLTWRLPDLRRATRMGVCSCLRSFLRYLHAAKLIDRDLAAAVSSPSLYRFEDIPRAFTESQIEAVLATTRRDRSASGLRDYAMLLMLATYGVRSGEVLRLRLEDIDWREERLRVRQSKTGIESFLPLMPPVGEAVLDYLKDARPQTDRREVFLRLRAPFGPLSNSGSLASVIFRRLKESGIEVNGRHGAHAFRFARALSLLRASVSPKWIGDLLGHRSSSSTQTYLRLATEDLRALSLEVPGRKQ
jgi:integrase/recombinase XerD